MQELEQKQARARILRQQHLLERAERVHELSKKVSNIACELLWSFCVIGHALKH